MRMMNAQETKPGTVRFGLITLLLLPLLISPLFASVVFVRQELSFSSRMGPFFNILACTALYAAIFTARSRRGAYENGMQGAHHVLPAARTGSCYGALFMGQIFVPLLMARVVAHARRQELSVLDFLQMSWAWVLELTAMVGGMLMLFGVFLGAFGGSIVGLLFEWRHRRRDAA